MNTVRNVLVIILSIVFVGDAFAHGGGLDKNRCHHNHKNGKLLQQIVLNTLHENRSISIILKYFIAI